MGASGAAGPVCFAPLFFSCQKLLRPITTPRKRLGSLGRLSSRKRNLEITISHAHRLFRTSSYASIHHSHRSGGFPTRQPAWLPTTVVPIRLHWGRQSFPIRVFSDRSFAAVGPVNPKGARHYVPFCRAYRKSRLVVGKSGVSSDARAMPLGSRVPLRGPPKTRVRLSC